MLNDACAIMKHMNIDSNGNIVVKRAIAGIEPTTSPTQRENHTTRPNGQTNIKLTYDLLLNNKYLMKH